METKGSDCNQSVDSIDSLDHQSDDQAKFNKVGLVINDSAIKINTLPDKHRGG